MALGYARGFSFEGFSVRLKAAQSQGHMTEAELSRFPYLVPSGRVMKTGHHLLAGGPSPVDLTLNSQCLLLATQGSLRPALPDGFCFLRAIGDVTELEQTVSTP